MTRAATYPEMPLDGSQPLTSCCSYERIPLLSTVRDQGTHLRPRLDMTYSQVSAGQQHYDWHGQEAGHWQERIAWRVKVQLPCVPSPSLNLCLRHLNASILNHSPSGLRVLTFGVLYPIYPLSSCSLCVVWPVLRCRRDTQDAMGE